MDIKLVGDTYNLREKNTFAINNFNILVKRNYYCQTLISYLALVVIQSKIKQGGDLQQNGTVTHYMTTPTLK